MIRGCLSLIISALAALLTLPINFALRFLASCLRFITAPLSLLASITSPKRKRNGHRSRSDYQRRYKHMRDLGYSPDRARRGAKGACYVATAIYGSYDCPEVWTLRRFRDYKLAATWYGRAFIRVYYAVSPVLVRYYGETRWFNNCGKLLLDKFVSVLQKGGLAATPYEDNPSQCVIKPRY